DVIDLKNLAHARVIYAWRMENPELHRGLGSVAPAYLKSHGRYYLVSGFQFWQGGPDVDLGAIVWDMTGLPDTSTIREVARIRAPEVRGGFHETFAYKHSNGRALLFATTDSPVAYVYDIDDVVSGAANRGVVGKVPHAWPDTSYLATRRGYHDFFVGYEPA